MLRWYLSRTPYFYTDWLWPHCVLLPQIVQTFHKIFASSLELFFLTVGQKNFGKKIPLTTFPVSLGLIIHSRQIVFTFAYLVGNFHNPPKQQNEIQPKIFKCFVSSFNKNWPSSWFGKIVKKLTFCSITAIFHRTLWNHHSTIRPQTSSRILEQIGIYMYCSQGETKDYAHC